MKNLLIALTLLVLAACKKEHVADNSDQKILTGYTIYSIAKGAHFSDGSTFKAFTGKGLSFEVVFDSTCIYQTTDPANQYDINKLYGFTEGHNNHENSARIGWSWNNGALRLYAYAYAAGERHTAEITSIAIGRPVQARIDVDAKAYIFTVGGTTVSLPRAASNLTVEGFCQYPYFGGDEAAPHTIYIYIKTGSH